MDPEALASVTGGTASVSFGEVTVDVPAGSWVAAVSAARDSLELDSFDWLSAVDQLEDGFDVVLHVYSVSRKHRALLRTRIPRTAPVLDSLVDVFAGANWHERETAEMFGIVFSGHPGLDPLLLPDGFTGHPLRKDFVLASRVAKEWPGAKEPGESHTGATRRRMQPLGVPTSWGPTVQPSGATPADRPARRERPTRAARAAEAAGADTVPTPDPPEARDTGGPGE